MTLPRSAEQLRADLRLRGVRILLDGDELVVRGQPTPDDLAELRARKPELMAYLTGPGALHERGRLDERYRLDLDDYGLTPPSAQLPDLRMQYFAWPRGKRELFNSRVNERALIHGRVAAELLVAGDLTLVAHELANLATPNFPSRIGFPAPSQADL